MFLFLQKLYERLQQNKYYSLTQEEYSEFNI